MMEKDVILALVVAVFGSTGLWTLVSTIWQHRSKKISTEGKMLRGLAHDRICELGSRYLKQGYITKDQYENLHDYLFIPYHDLGGNGTAEKITEDVKRLPIKEVANENSGQGI